MRMRMRPRGLDLKLSGQAKRSVTDSDSQIDGSIAHRVWRAGATQRSVFSWLCRVQGHDTVTYVMRRLHTSA